MCGPGAEQGAVSCRQHTQEAPNPAAASIGAGSRDPDAARQQETACSALAASWHLAAIQAGPALYNGYSRNALLISAALLDNIYCCIHDSTEDDHCLPIYTESAEGEW